MAGTSKADPPEPGRLPRALIVDDDEGARRTLASALRRCGFDAIEACDGLSGLRTLVDHVLEIDLLVTDLEMPGLCGERLVRTVRFLGGERDLPILVFSGRLEGGRGDRVLAAGASDAVDKARGPHAAALAARRLVARADRLASDPVERTLAEPVALARIRLAPARSRPS